MDTKQRAKEIYENYLSARREKRRSAGFVVIDQPIKPRHIKEMIELGLNEGLFGGRLD